MNLMECLIQCVFCIRLSVVVSKVAELFNSCCALSLCGNIEEGSRQNANKTHTHTEDNGIIHPASAVYARK